MPAFHRFEHAGKRYVIDPETCFCFECDAISWDVIAHFPETPANRILHLLESRHERRELDEVLGELEWLRSSKSILQQPDAKTQFEKLAADEGLRLLVAVQVPAERIGAAAAYLMARSGAQADLRLELRWQAALPRDLDAVSLACAGALRMARAAGKRLCVALRVDGIALRKPPRDVAGHRLDVLLEVNDPEHVAPRVKQFAASGLDDLGRIAKAVVDGVPCGRIVLTPQAPDFAKAVAALDDSGFPVIEIDIESAFIAQPAHAAAFLDGMCEAARYYAERLLKGHYFRLDPIAELFWRIHNGTPILRHDLAGTNLLAIDAHGDIYPSAHFMGNAEFRIGNLDTGAWDEARRAPFADSGVMTTPACMRCYARHLCGGGTAAVHRAQSGSLRMPHAAWCDAQRAWLQMAIAAFSMLSAHGVDFSRVYQNLTPAPRPSLWKMAKAAFSMSIGMRPIAEADAPLLQKWEDWNDAVYFTLAEGGMRMATRYDREMDALHPSGFEHEFLLLRKNGAPMGLLKLRPEQTPGNARAWIYLRDPKDYADEAVRKSFRFMLNEAAGQQALRRLSVPAGPKEDALARFLEAVGFRLEGTQREALYLHAKYEDVRSFALALE